MRHFVLSTLILFAASVSIAVDSVGKVEFDPKNSSIKIPGAALVAQSIDDPARFSKGMLLVSLPPSTDVLTIGGGVFLGRIVDGHLGWMDPHSYALALKEEDPPRVIVMPLSGWERGVDYAVRVTDRVKDVDGAPVAPSGTTWVTTIEDINTREDIANLPPEVARAANDYRSRKTAGKNTPSTALPDQRFPGGQNLLWKGMWTDPLTGLAYGRNRWYDARTGMWLSPDPAGPVDSPNLYAGFAWRPHLFNDPMGDVITFANDTARRHFRSVLNFAIENHGIEGMPMFLAGLLALHDSPTEYRIGTFSSAGSQAKGGVTQGVLNDKWSNLDRVDVLVGTNHGWSARERLAHEIQHAIQFELGFVSFRQAKVIDVPANSLGKFYRKRAKREAEGKPLKPIPYKTVRTGGILYDVWDEFDAFRIQCMFESNLSEGQHSQLLGSICLAIDSDDLQRFLDAAPPEYATRERSNLFLYGDSQLDDKTKNSGANLWDVNGDGRTIEIWNAPTASQYFGLLGRAGEVDEATDAEVQAIMAELLQLAARQ